MEQSSSHINLVFVTVIKKYNDSHIYFKVSTGGYKDDLLFPQMLVTSLALIDSILLSFSFEKTDPCNLMFSLGTISANITQHRLPVMEAPPEQVESPHYRLNLIIFSI
jgi:hypothetical protein